MDVKGKTTAKMIALVRGLAQETVAWLIDEWVMPQRPESYSKDDRD